MFENSGRKIKSLAIIITVLNMIASIIGAIIMWSNSSYGYGYRRYVNGGMVAGGFGILIFGILVAYIIGLLLYGFGELIESNSEIARCAKEKNEKSEPKAANTAVNQNSGLTNSVPSAAAHQYSTASAPVEAEKPAVTFDASDIADIEQFLTVCEGLDSRIDAKKLWQESDLSKNEAYADITKVIDKAAQMERMYGKSPLGKANMINEIRSLLK